MKIIGTLLKYFDSGRNNVFGRIYGVVQLFLTLAIYFKIEGKNFGLTQILFYSLLLSLFLLFAGFIYVKTGLYQSENQSRNYDNPEIMEIVYNTRKLLEEKKWN